MGDKSTATSKRKALGRGLDALIAKRPTAVAPERTTDVVADAGTERVRHVPIASIDPNPHQPRSVFDDTSIAELAQSIRVDGLIQPILVRPHGGRYMIVVGERRWRAAQQAGLDEIPAVVREVEDDRILEIALIENIQREDLNPIEVAQALQRLAQELQLSHDELAQRTGKDRSTVTNLLRLLRLPSDIQKLVADRLLSMGHARALLALPDAEAQRAVAARVVDGALSVRQVEELVRRYTTPPEPKPEKPVDPNISAAVEELERALGTRVKLVQRGKKRGRIEIEYGSQEELDRIYALLTGTD